MPTVTFFDPIRGREVELRDRAGGPAAARGPPRGAAHGRGRRRRDPGRRRGDRDRHPQAPCAAGRVTLVARWGSCVTASAWTRSTARPPRRVGSRYGTCPATARRGGRPCARPSARRTTPDPAVRDGDGRRGLAERRSVAHRFHPAAPSPDAGDHPGAGRIGRLVAAKARAFGFRTIAYDPFITAAVDADLPIVDRDELFATSDAIVVCAAYTPGAPPLISREALAAVKPGLIVVNISRGGHIDEHALAEALRDGRVAVAALDIRRHRATRPGRRSAVPPAQRRPDPAHRRLLARGRGRPPQARRRVRLGHARGRRPHLGGRLMARYPQGILVACPSPWDDNDELVEELLREEVRLVLAAGFEHCYVFGTGGEGYAAASARSSMSSTKRSMASRSAPWSASSACPPSR